MMHRTPKGVSSKPRMSLEVDDPRLLTEPPTRIADLRTYPRASLMATATAAIR